MKKKLISMFLSAIIISSMIIVGAPNAEAAVTSVDDFTKFAREQEGKVGADFGFGTSGWCGYFIWWCANQKGLTNTDVYPTQRSSMGSVDNVASWFAKNASYTYFFSDSPIVGGALTTKEKYTPLPGDIAIIRSYTDSTGGTVKYRWSHAALVYAVDDTYIYVVHGSWDNKVCVGKFRRNGLSNSQGSTTSKAYSVNEVAGYARPNYTYNSSEVANPPPPTVQATAEGSKVLVSWNQVANATSYDVYVLQSPWSWEAIKYSGTASASANSYAFDNVADGSYKAFVIARPNPDTAQSNWAAVDVAATTTTTKTQYRYHRYADSAGHISVCAYFGGNKYGTTMAIQYTDWLDSPLAVDNGTANYYVHARQSACESKGCIDPSCNTNRFNYNGAYYYYEETRTVIVETPVAKKTHTVYFNANGGSVGTAQITVTENAAYGTLPTPILKDYTFDGWYNSAVEGSLISSASVFGLTTDQTLYAHWTKQYKGSFTNFTNKKTWSDNLFSDISTSEWFYSNSKTVYQLGLMNGVGSRAFSPNTNVTIAETITLAARLHNIYYNGAETFASYDGGNWYDGYVDYAEENGIISGTYNMNAVATRGQFAQILAAAFNDDKALSVLRNVEFSNIPDVSGSESYGTAVLRLYRAGVVTGSDSKGTFNPNSTISRAEVAAIVARMAVPELRIGK